MQKDCTSCGAPIHVLKNKATGAWMPVDDEIHEDGTILVDVDASECEVLAGNRLVAARLGGEALSRSHFATCPDAPRHRRRRR